MLISNHVRLIKTTNLEHLIMNNMNLLLTINNFNFITKLVHDVYERYVKLINNYKNVQIIIVFWKYRNFIRGKSPRYVGKNEMMYMKSRYKSTALYRGLLKYTLTSFSCFAFTNVHDSLRLASGRGSQYIR